MAEQESTAEKRAALKRKIDELSDARIEKLHKQLIGVSWSVGRPERPSRAFRTRSHRSAQKF